MAKVATRGPMMGASKPLLFSGGMDGGSSGGSSKVTNVIKRKTPSELREEQLKRNRLVELMDESPAPELGSMMNPIGVTSEPMKPILSKNPKYIDTRVDELFPSRKNSLRLKMLNGKEHVKENITGDHIIKNSSLFSKSADRQPECSGLKVKNSLASESHITTKRCSNSTFRSIMDLTTGGDKSSSVSLDMDEAFKGLAARDPPIVSKTESFDGSLNLPSERFCSELHIPSPKTPLDFTLKTSMRVVASSSVSWFHRLMSSGTFDFSNTQISNAKSLYSWVYPQCSLPPSVISALNLSSKGGGQMDFLNKRQMAWEASFRSLYVMFRKNICNLFYVCTGQFVVMFTNTNASKSKGACNAYVSQSTQTLRSLLKEQDISFTMPLCHSKVEQETKEDLFELSEIEKYNLGKTRRTVSLSDVDNSPESLLAFSDNNVFGLYDFLLNYRILFPSLNTLDVPVLYSPVPFENGAISVPEVKCKEVKRIDSENKGSFYTIEIKDAYIPPWIISNVCDTMKSKGESFEASFVMEPMSIGLNVGLDLKATSDSDEQSCLFGVKNTVASDKLSRGFLKGLKYSDETYMATLSPV